MFKLIPFGFFTLTDKHGESCVMHRIWRMFFLESLTCSPLHRVTAPIIRMWFQLKSRTCNVSLMAEKNTEDIYKAMKCVFIRTPTVLWT